MPTLHLIVHKSMIEDSIKTGGMGYSVDKLQTVLQHIEEVERSEKDVKRLEFAKGNYPWPGSLNQLLNMCNGYSRVILYGISKECCVKWVREDLRKVGIEAVIDEQGAI